MLGFATRRDARPMLGAGLGARNPWVLRVSEAGGRCPLALCAQLHLAHVGLQSSLPLAASNNGGSEGPILGAFPAHVCDSLRATRRHPCRMCLS